MADKKQTNNGPKTTNGNGNGQGNGNGKQNGNFRGAVDALFQGMDKVVSSKTVVGDAITVGDTTIIPLVDVSFGLGVGASTGDKKDKGQGGLGGKINPSAVLVIKDKTTRLINIKNQDTMTKILDLIPEVMDRLKERKEDKVTEEEVNDLLNKASRSE